TVQRLPENFSWTTASRYTANPASTTRPTRLSFSPRETQGRRPEERVFLRELEERCRVMWGLYALCKSTSRTGRTVCTAAHSRHHADREQRLKQGSNVSRALSAALQRPALYPDPVEGL